MDMHAPFRKAIADDPELRHAVVVHDPFHIMKRAGEALSEQRRAVFFRAGPELRAVGRGTRWMVLKAWEKTTDNEKATLRQLFSLNSKLARAYQVVDELRAVLKAPDDTAMAEGMWHVLCRTRRRDNVPMRKLHDSLVEHMPGDSCSRCPPSTNGTYRGPEQQLGDLSAPRQGLSQSPVPPHQVALHHRQPCRD